MTRGEETTREKERDGKRERARKRQERESAKERRSRRATEKGGIERWGKRYGAGARKRARDRGQEER